MSEIAEQAPFCFEGVSCLQRTGISYFTWRDRLDERRWDIHLKAKALMRDRLRDLQAGEPKEPKHEPRARAMHVKSAKLVKVS